MKDEPNFIGFTFFLIFMAVCAVFGVKFIVETVADAISFLGGLI